MSKPMTLDEILQSTELFGSSAGKYGMNRECQRDAIIDLFLSKVPKEIFGQKDFVDGHSKCRTATIQAMEGMR